MAFGNTYFWFLLNDFTCPNGVPFSIVKLHFPLRKSTKNSDAGYSPRYEVPFLKLLGVSWVFFFFLSKKNDLFVLGLQNLLFCPLIICVICVCTYHIFHNKENVNYIMWPVPNVFLAQYIDQCSLSHQHWKKYTKTSFKRRILLFSCYLDIYIRPSCILSVAENTIYLIIKYR